MGHRFPVSLFGQMRVCRGVFKTPDGMMQGYDFPEAAVRRGRQVPGFANTPVKGNALLLYVENSGRDDAELWFPAGSGSEGPPGSRVRKYPRKGQRSMRVKA